MGVFRKPFHEIGAAAGSANTAQDLAAKFGAANTADILAAAGGEIHGVFRDTVTTSGEANDVQVDGIILGMAGGTFADGDDLMVDAASKFVKAELGSIRVGKALEAGSSGQPAQILLYRRGQERPRVRGANTASVAGSTVPPQGADYFHVTGTNAITGWTNPAGLQDGARFSVIPDGVFTWTAAGNIALAGTAVVSKLLDFQWDATTGKWYPSYIA
jgi:hypothetical protein